MQHICRRFIYIYIHIPYALNQWPFQEFQVPKLESTYQAYVMVPEWANSGAEISPMGISSSSVLTMPKWQFSWENRWENHGFPHFLQVFCRFDLGIYLVAAPLLAFMTLVVPLFGMHLFSLQNQQNHLANVTSGNQPWLETPFIAFTYDFPNYFHLHWWGCCHMFLWFSHIPMAFPCFSYGFPIGQRPTHMVLALIIPYPPTPPEAPLVCGRRSTQGGDR